MKALRTLMFVMVLSAGLVAFSGGYVSASSSSSDGSADYWHPYPTNVQPGDILFGHSPDVDWIIPGYWTHVGMVAYYDYSVGDWIVIEAYYPRVHLVTLKDFMKRYDTFAIGRVYTSDYVKQRAIQFAYQQLGKPYSFNYFKKPSVYDDSYYCSELVWASYMYASNYSINLDANPGWSWKYGYAVAPQEVWDSDWVHIVYYHSD